MTVFDRPSPSCVARMWQGRHLLTRKMEISWACGGGPWRSGLVRACRGGVGQAAWAGSVPSGAGSGGAAEGDFEAGSAERAGVAGDLAAGVALALVVVRAEVGVAHAGVSQQRGGLQLGVPGRGACPGRAASSGQPPVPGAFAGLGPAGRHRGLAEVFAALLGFGASGARAGLVVWRGAAAPGGQVRAGAEPAHARAGSGRAIPCPSSQPLTNRGLDGNTREQRGHRCRFDPCRRAARLAQVHGTGSSPWCSWPLAPSGGALVVGNNLGYRTPVIGRQYRVGDPIIVHGAEPQGQAPATPA